MELMSEISFFDLSKYCRTCFGECPDDGYNVENLSAPLLRLFKQCVPFERPQKDLTNLLCPLCYDMLKSFEEFRSKALARTYLLEKFLKTKLLSSVTDNVDTRLVQHKTGDKEESSTLLSKSSLESNASDISKWNMELSGENLEILDFEESLSNSETGEMGEIEVSEINKYQDKFLYKCTYCNQSFRHTAVLSKHLREAHQLKITFTVCTFKGCKKTFQHNETAMQHYEIDHVKKNTPSMCEICGETCENAEELKDHRYNTHGLETELISFEEEPAKIATSKSNTNEGKPLHSKNKSKEMLIYPKKTTPAHRAYTCPYCDRNFYYPTTLSQHLIAVHNMEPNFTCCPYENCNDTFQHEETATLHFKHNHQADALKEETCMCEVCGEKFKSEDKLKKHRYKHDPDARPFQCEICKKRFVVRTSYKEHLLRHAGIKEFECPKCDAKKTSAAELRNHLNIHNEEKIHKCPLCPRVFRWPTALGRHKKIFHRGIRDHKCRYCDRAFGKAENLRHHERRHTGEKPFECKICEKRFISTAALHTHKKTKMHREKEKELSETSNFKKLSAEVDVSCEEKE